MAVLRLSAGAADAARAEAAARWPAEACGLLVGLERAGAERWVERVVAVPNGREHDARRRYRIPPHALRAAEADAGREGLIVLGAFHSHPDGGAEPSRYDLEHAWPWYTYLILPMDGGAAGFPRAWRLAEDRGAFLEETVVEEGR